MTMMPPSGKGLLRIDKERISPPLPRRHGISHRPKADGCQGMVAERPTDEIAEIARRSKLARRSVGKNDVLLGVGHDDEILGQLDRRQIVAVSC